MYIDGNAFRCDKEGIIGSDPGGDWREIGK